MARTKTEVRPKKSIKDLQTDLIRSFEHAHDQLRVAHANQIENVKQNHRLNMRSEYQEAYTFPVVVEETHDGFRVYDCLYLTKPLYRKIELLAQIRDEGFTRCLIWLADQMIDSVLDNNDEMGPLIKKRILEEAYDLGKESKAKRDEDLEKAIEDEKI